ncbi:MAG: GTP-binding protein [Rhodospirillaceae bacterium]|jgi:G3E family GTPase|nr:GTP-binding protein [Rhodospirillaceae bacterium]MBT4085486.1 GTP-binding protein [Alphaproteobacteria bacterium]MBT6218550.1 GTP-binding protein [Rhodospirillaceae bacterium]MBT6588691.1 GTP-binding protein [Rhodospirillaceae bacterium]
MAAPVPLSVIGGFLGTGKTTLLNQLLNNRSGVRFAVLINDFGDIVVDGDLIADHNGESITFANGCVCCSLGNDLLATLTELLERDPPPEQIFVEASGVADPRTIADFAALDAELLRDLVFVVVDVQTLRERASDDRLSDTVRRQIASADLIIMNKCDLVDDVNRCATRLWLETQRGDIPIIETEYARVPFDFLSAVPSSDVSVDEILHHPHSTNHTELFHSETLDMIDPVDLTALRRGLEALPRSVLRVKGFVPIQGRGELFFLVQLSGREIEISPWQGRAPARAGLIVIGTPDMPDKQQLDQIFLIAR